jgi:hypothetical protein
MLKKLRIPIIFLLVEVLLYIMLKPVNTEMFFLSFVVFSGSILIYNIFSVSTNSTRMDGIGGGRDAARMSLTTMKIEKQYETPASRNRFGGGILDPSNISLGFFVLVNIVIYWWIMPK